MKFFERRTPDTNDESQNYWSFSIFLFLIGFIASFVFNRLVFKGLIGADLIYLNGIILFLMLLTAVKVVISKVKRAQLSRKLQSFITILMGWGFAMQIIERFI
jgi:hypothetical protein